MLHPPQKHLLLVQSCVLQLLPAVRTVWRENATRLRNINTSRALRGWKTWMGRTCECHAMILHGLKRWGSSTLKKNPKGRVGARIWATSFSSWVQRVRGDTTKSGSADRKYGGRDSLWHPLAAAPLPTARIQAHILRKLLGFLLLVRITPWFSCKAAAFVLLQLPLALTSPN